MPIADCQYFQSATGNGKSKGLLLFVAELVANAPDGQHHLRVFGVFFNLGSQAIDV